MVLFQSVCQEEPFRSLGVTGLTLVPPIVDIRAAPIVDLFDGSEGRLVCQGGLCSKHDKIFTLSLLSQQLLSTHI